MILSKLEIAKRQLEVAAQLYVDGADDLAVITLAGAAEEILGKLLRRTEQKSMADHIVELDKKLTGGRPFNVVSDAVNRARNALKHARDQSEDLVKIEPGEATAMFGRALLNYVRLVGQPTPVMQVAYLKFVSDVRQT